MIVIIILILLFLYIFFYKIVLEPFDSTIKINNSKIPLIIHQTWKSKDLSNNQNFIKGQNSWKTLNPNFVYKFYDDNDCLNFINNYYPQYSNFYNKLKPVEKADIFRYLIIHKYGGVYADIDTICLKSIQETLIKPMIVGIEYDPKHNKGKTQIIQWFFASVPNNPIFIKLIDEMISRKNLVDIIGYTIPLLFDNRNPFDKNEKTYWLTGPYIFSDLILKLPKDSIKIFERCTFGSYDTTKKCRDKAYLIHGFEGSWKENWKESRKRW